MAIAAAGRLKSSLSPASPSPVCVPRTVRFAALAIGYAAARDKKEPAVSEITTIQLDNGHRLYVEAESVELPRVASSADSAHGLPAGAEPTGPVDDAIDSLKELRGSIAGLADAVYDSLAENPPDEWSLELSFGFKGKAAIPVLLSGEANSGLKLTAKWKRRDGQ